MINSLYFFGGTGAGNCEFLLHALCLALVCSFFISLWTWQFSWWRKKWFSGLRFGWFVERRNRVEGFKK